jgi:hypothetical protein
MLQIDSFLFHSYQKQEVKESIKHFISSFFIFFFILLKLFNIIKIIGHLHQQPRNQKIMILS